MESIDWIRDNWGTIYGGGVIVVGLLTVIIVFFGVWWFAADKYALGGLVLGWVPGAVAAATIGAIMGIGWPVLAPLAIWLARALGPGLIEKRRWANRSVRGRATD